MQDKVQELIDKIRPSLQADGGDIKLISVKDGIVEVQLQGACAGCPMSQMTLKQGVERVIREAMPEIKEVRAV